MQKVSKEDMKFKDLYYNQLRPKLKEELKLNNIFAVPKLIKITINVGAGEAATNKQVLDKISNDLTTISGQKPVITLARKSISAFKIRKGMPIGVKVTLRGDRMYDFLERLVKVVIPRFRDFRGIAQKSLDKAGNLNLGISEQTLFPEVDYDKIDRIRGLEVTIVTSTYDREKSKKFLESLGIPFNKD